MTRFQCRRVPACVSFKWSSEIFKQNICSEIVFRDVRSMRLLNVLVKLMKYDPKQNFSGEKILHHYHLKCNNLDNRELLNITLKAR